jgi:hypothetical protein
VAKPSAVPQPAPGAPTLEGTRDIGFVAPVSDRALKVALS